MNGLKKFVKNKLLNGEPDERAALEDVTTATKMSSLKVLISSKIPGHVGRVDDLYSSREFPSKDKISSF